MEGGVTEVGHCPSDCRSDSGDVILVTGGCGFIGSHTARHLLSSHRDAKVVVLDKLSYCARMENISDMLHLSRFVFVQGDVCNMETVDAVLHEHKVSHVLHFAAQSHVDNSFGSTLQFTHNNVVGTHVLLEACKNMQSQLRLFIHVSTDEVYGPIDGSHPASEDTTVLRPTNPYAASKAAAEMIVAAYRTSFHLPIIITRGNNAYGPQQYPEKLIPKFSMLAVQGKPLPIHGSGEQLRSYLHVRDIAVAYALLLEKGEPGATYNIATPDEVSVLKVAGDISLALGLENAQLQHVEDRLFQDTSYALDTSKMVSLGWQPSISWEDGIEETVLWYKEHMDYWGEEATKTALQPHTMLPES